MNSFSDIVSGKTPVLVDFHAEWCGPCKMMPPVLDEVKKQLGENIRILKVDVDKNPSAANIYKVQSVPTLMIFQNGKIQWRQSGVVPAVQLISILEKL